MEIAKSQWQAKWNIIFILLTYNKYISYSRKLANCGSRNSMLLQYAECVVASVAQKFALSYGPAWNILHCNGHASLLQHGAQLALPAHAWPNVTATYLYPKPYSCCMALPLLIFSNIYYIVVDIVIPGGYYAICGALWKAEPVLLISIIVAPTCALCLYSLLIINVYCSNSLDKDTAHLTCALVKV